jgi:hypothetical protein
MGRGRAKAKQTKVARELKYHSPNTDLAALERELARKANSNSDGEQQDEYVDEDDGTGGTDEGTWTTRSR